MRDLQTTLAPVDTSTRIGCCADVSLCYGAGEAERLAQMFKALSHPVRLQIVALLSRYGGQVCVCDIEAQFALKQPTISHHLKVLRQAGLIESVQHGLWVYYHVRPTALRQLCGVCDGMLDEELLEAKPAAN